MTDNRRTVVPFERPAAYWAVRARRHYTPARLPDAARLMRKALEKSGDTGMALELAQIYAGMECHTAAERCLVRAVARGGLTGGICFSIGCCALSRGQEDLAERALDLSLRLDPGGAFADQAQDTLDLYPWLQQECLPRGARGETLLQWAKEALALGDEKRALSLARRSWEKSHSAQGAMLLGALLPARESVPYFAFAVRHLPGEDRPLLLLTRACFENGQTDAARRHLNRARALCSTIAQAEAFCAVAWEMGETEAALHLIREKLEHFPASVDYLRLKYLTLKRAGDETGAARTLETLLDIDPDDAAGLWYRRHPEDLKPYPGRMMLLTALGCQIDAVPPRLKYGPLNRILHLMTIGLADTLDAPVIYRLLPPLWKHLSPAEKRSCDEHRSTHYPLAFGLYLLLITGNQDRAREFYQSAPGKKRAKRALRRFARWMNEEGYDALHQF